MHRNATESSGMWHQLSGERSLQADVTTTITIATIAMANGRGQFRLMVLAMQASACSPRPFEYWTIMKPKPKRKSVRLLPPGLQSGTSPAKLATTGKPSSETSSSPRCASPVGPKAIGVGEHTSCAPRPI